MKNNFYVNCKENNYGTLNKVVPKLLNEYKHNTEETLQLCINGEKNEVVIETLKQSFENYTRYIMFMNELYKCLHGCSTNEVEVKNPVEPIYRLKNGQFCNKNQLLEEIRNNDGKMFEAQTAGVQTPVYAMQNIKDIKAKIKKLPRYKASLIAAGALPLPYFNGWMKVKAEPTHIKNSITGFERPFCLKTNVWIDWLIEHYEYIIKKQMEIM